MGTVMEERSDGKVRGSDNEDFVVQDSNGNG
jgi:hypothetical protein